MLISSSVSPVLLAMSLTLKPKLFKLQAYPVHYLVLPRPGLVPDLALLFTGAKIRLLYLTSKLFPHFLNSLSQDDIDKGSYVPDVHLAVTVDVGGIDGEVLWGVAQQITDEVAHVVGIDLCVTVHVTF